MLWRPSSRNTTTLRKHWLLKMTYSRYNVYTFCFCCCCCCCCCCFVTVHHLHLTSRPSMTVLIDLCPVLTTLQKTLTNDEKRYSHISCLKYCLSLPPLYRSHLLSSFLFTFIRFLIGSQTWYHYQHLERSCWMTPISSNTS